MTKKGCHHLIMICWKFWWGNQFRFSPNHIDIQNDEECNYKRGSNSNFLPKISYWVSPILFYSILLRGSTYCFI